MRRKHLMTTLTQVASCLIVGALICLTVCISSADTPLSPDLFRTNASFAVDNRSLSLATAVATIEPRPGAPGYSWLRISFYAFAPQPDDLVGIAKGDVRSMDKRWTKLADKHDNSYNLSWAS